VVVLQKFSQKLIATNARLFQQNFVSEIVSRTSEIFLYCRIVSFKNRSDWHFQFKQCWLQWHFQFKTYSAQWGHNL